MSEKKKYDSDTLSQQRKARQEFLELKKIQGGEIPAPPPPRAVAKSPKTVEEKTRNFWYYYHWHVIAFVFFSIVLAIIIKQCASRVNYDLTVTVYTSNPVSDDSCKKIGEYFEKYCYDINGDGEIHINVINCSYQEGGSRQVLTATSSKLQAILVADYYAVLFITDNTTYEFLNSISDSANLLETDGVMLDADFYKYCDNDKYFELPSDLKISRRAYSDTVLSDNKTANYCYNAAGQILKSIRK